MDQATIQWVLISIITVLGGGFSLLFQHQLKRNDEEHASTIERMESHLRDQDIRIQNNINHIQKIEVDMVEKVGREEIKEFYRMFEGVKRELKEDLKELKLDLMEAFLRREEKK